MKKVLFIDRDGTLIEEPEDFQVDCFTKLKLLPGMLSSLSRIATEMDFELVMVSNQDGLGTESLREEDFYPVHNFLLSLLESEGVRFSKVCIDRSFEHENEPTRKPRTGMLTEYLSKRFDLANSFVIGDRDTDVQLAKNLGAKAIFIKNPNFEPPPTGSTIALLAENWKQIYEFLKFRHRKASLRRTTSETDIWIELNLDGRGEHDIKTGLPFFDHMLAQLARHGGLDLTLTANGDLEVCDHHTIEDTAIVLGSAFSTALGEKRGIERYGFTLPMDDCLAQVAIDLGGRSWLVWDVEFHRETIGGVSTEMFFHFFKSFTDEARLNLNIRADGTNEHHKIESIFKAVARALKMAVRQDVANALTPSTKGVF